MHKCFCNSNHQVIMLTELLCYPCYQVIQVIMLFKLFYIKALKDFITVFLQTQLQMDIVYQKTGFKSRFSRFLMYIEIIIRFGLKKAKKSYLQYRESPYTLQIFSLFKTKLMIINICTSKIIKMSPYTIQVSQTFFQGGSFEISKGVVSLEVVISCLKVQKFFFPPCFSNFHSAHLLLSTTTFKMLLKGTYQDQ